MRVEAEGDELIYTGANVMLGYAENRDDLAKGDELKGELRTGDLARQDESGYFYLTGRKTRFLKIFGQRFSLDEVESMLRRHFDMPIVCYGSDDRISVAIEDHSQLSAVHKFMCNTYHLHDIALEVKCVAEIPRTSSGKVDYNSLAHASGS